MENVINHFVQQVQHLVSSFDPSLSFISTSCLPLNHDTSPTTALQKYSPPHTPIFSHFDSWKHLLSSLVAGLPLSHLNHFTSTQHFCHSVKSCLSFNPSTSEASLPLLPCCRLCPELHFSSTIEHINSFCVRAKSYHTFQP